MFSTKPRAGPWTHFQQVLPVLRRGRGGVFRAAERFAGGTFSPGARTSSRILWGLHPGAGDHNNRTARLWGFQGRCGEKNVPLGVWS